MRALKISLLVFILSITVSAQWYLQQSGTNNSLYGVAFTDSLSGTAVGGNGIIIRTTDGGENWISNYIGTNTHLNGICFIDSLTGFIVGNSGTILKTIDKGNSWISQTSGTNYNLNAVSFSDANFGTAVGYLGIIIRTTDAGSTWVVQASGTFPELYDVCFTNENTGTAVGGQSIPPGSPVGIILRTTNGGTDWITQDIDYNMKLGVYFIDSNIGWWVGQGGYIYKTTNGGNNWICQAGPCQGSPSDWLYDIHFINESIGYSVGVNGRILRTTDGGNEWILQPSGTNQTMFGVYFTDENYGTAVGGDGIILRTTNGGGVITFLEEQSFIPNEFSLSQNYPNPFNPTTSLQYAIGSRQYVTLKVYDNLGNEVATLVNEEKPAGEYEVEFDCNALPSGIYFYQLKAGSYSDTKKMILLK